MNKKDFKPEKFFLLDEAVKHKGIFDNVEYVWDAIKKIESYVEKFFNNISGFNLEQRVKKDEHIKGDVYYKGSEPNLNGVYVLAGAKVYLEESVVFKPTVVFDSGSCVYIGKSSIIGPNVTFEGKNIIGEECVIRHGSYCRGNTILGNKCIVRAEIKNSYLLDYLSTSKGYAVTSASHFNYIGDSIVGRGVNLGAGTILSNVKILWTKIKPRIEGLNLEPFGFKMGSILGDNVGTGCNSVIAPGTIIGKGTKIYANVTASGYIPENRIIKSKNEIVPLDKIEETLDGREYKDF